MRLADTKGKVNAVDRIGKGPSYDRPGRVFSMTKAALLNPRPNGADRAILNEFPASSVSPTTPQPARSGIPSAVRTASQNSATRPTETHTFSRPEPYQNHINGMAMSHEGLAKALFLGGVTHRFPQLRFGFLDGGVAWA